jgi:hypothetical protein
LETWKDHLGPGWGKREKSLRDGYSNPLQEKGFSSQLTPPALLSGKREPLPSTFTRFSITKDFSVTGRDEPRLVYHTPDDTYNLYLRPFSSAASHSGSSSRLQCSSKSFKIRWWSWEKDSLFIVVLTHSFHYYSHFRSCWEEGRITDLQNRRLRRTEGRLHILSWDMCGTRHV